MTEKLIIPVIEPKDFFIIFILSFFLIFQDYNLQPNKVKITAVMIPRAVGIVYPICPQYVTIETNVRINTATPIRQNSNVFLLALL